MGIRGEGTGPRGALLVVYPLSVQGNSVGAMNLYSDSPGVFGEAQTRRAEQFAAEATVAVGLAARLADQAEPL